MDKYGRAVAGQQSQAGWGWVPSSARPALSEIRTVKFREVLKGYHRDDVDRYLLRAAVEADFLVFGLLNDGPSDLLAPSLPVLSEICTVKFRETLKGYHRDDVDRYLERAAQEVESLLGGKLTDPPPTPWNIPKAIPEAWPTVSAFPDTRPTVSTPGTAEHDPSPPAHPIRWTLSVIWALVPIFTLGFLSAPCVLYAAIRLRSRRLGAFTAIYTAFTACSLWLSSYPFDSWQSSSSATIFLCMGWIATIHCFGILRQVVSPDSDPQSGWRRELS